MSGLTFKIAEREDSQLILDYIRKLAEYEKRLDEVIATPDDIEKWVFDEKQAEVIFAFAVLSNQIHQLTVAQQVDIHYLSAPKGDKLIAKATCRKSGRTSSIVNVDVSDDMGRDVAQFIGTGFKL